MKNSPVFTHDSDLTLLWSLRLLEHALTAGGRKARAAEVPDELDLMLHEHSSLKKPQWNRKRRSRLVASPSRLEVAKHIAGFLDVEFDEDDAGVVTRMRALLQREMSGCVRRIGERSPLEALGPECRASVQAMTHLLGLSTSESLCLTFLVLLATEPQLERASSALGHSLDDRAADRAIAAATGVPEGEVSRAFAGGSRLMSAGLLKRDRCSMQLTGKFDFCARSFPLEMRVEGFDPIKALRDKFAIAPAPTLKWADFKHLGEIGEIAKIYLRNAVEARKSGVGLLIWGPPGAGKSEFARVIAKDIGAELIEVSNQDSDGDPIGGPARLQALRLAQEFTARRKAMVVFDECSDAFPTVLPAFLGGGQRNHAAKGWINRVLENSPVATVWITNSVDMIDPAILRRFLVVEFKSPPEAVREAQLRNLKVNLSDKTIARLVNCKELTAGVISLAADVVESVAAALPNADVSRHLELVVDQTLRAQGHGGLKTTLAVPEIYDPKYINADVDLVRMLEGLRTVGSARILMVGIPGSGKTSFAHHVARTLGRKLIVRRASDLVSKWVGETERLIAAAFRDAQETGSVLLIDEFDQFVQDRSRAQQSWQVSQVAELLIALEEFQGIFLASSNFIEGADSAIHRRFDLHVTFHALRSAQAVELLQAHLRNVGLPEAGPEEINRLSRLTVLTPGDYATVARQNRFNPLTTPDAWVGALEAECRHKPNPRTRPAIGFGGAAA